MKRTMIAALAAAQMTATACPAQAVELQREEPATRRSSFEERIELARADGEAQVASVPAAEEEPRKKKRKSTGDKILTGAAVVLGVGALAVGGLLVAIFVD